MTETTQGFQNTGEFLLSWLIRRELSINDLSELTAYSPSTLRKWLTTGKARARMGKEAFTYICDVMEIPLENVSDVVWLDCLSRSQFNDKVKTQRARFYGTTEPLPGKKLAVKPYNSTTNNIIQTLKDAIDLIETRSFTSLDDVRAFLKENGPYLTNKDKVELSQLIYGVN